MAWGGLKDSTCAGLKRAAAQGQNGQELQSHIQRGAQEAQDKGKTPQLLAPRSRGTARGGEIPKDARDDQSFLFVTSRDLPSITMTTERMMVVIILALGNQKPRPPSKVLIKNFRLFRK